MVDGVRWCGVSKLSLASRVEGDHPGLRPEDQTTPSGFACHPSGGGEYGSESSQWRRVCPTNSPPPEGWPQAGVVLSPCEGVVPRSGEGFLSLTRERVPGEPVLFTTAESLRAGD